MDAHPENEIPSNKARLISEGVEIPAVVVEDGMEIPNSMLSEPWGDIVEGEHSDNAQVAAMLHGETGE